MATLDAYWIGESVVQCVTLIITHRVILLSPEVKSKVASIKHSQIIFQVSLAGYPEVIDFHMRSKEIARLPQSSVPERRPIISTCAYRLALVSSSARDLRQSKDNRRFLL